MKRINILLLGLTLVIFTAQSIIADPGFSGGGSNQLQTDHLQSQSAHPHPYPPRPWPPRPYPPRPYPPRPWPPRPYPPRPYPYGPGWYSPQVYVNYPVAPVVITPPVSYSSVTYTSSAPVAYNTNYPAPISPPAKVNPVGGYLGIKMGVGFLTMPNVGLNTNYSVQNGFSAGLELGANLTQNLAVEAGFMRLPDINTPGYGKQTIWSVTNNQFSDLALKLSIPVQDTMALSVKLGAAYATSNFNLWRQPTNATNAVVPLFGVGLIAQATNSLAFELQYESTLPHGNNPTNAVPGMGVVSVGLLANF